MQTIYLNNKTTIQTKQLTNIIKQKSNTTTSQQVKPTNKQNHPNNPNSKQTYPQTKHKCKQQYIAKIQTPAKQIIQQNKPTTSNTV